LLYSTLGFQRERDGSGSQLIPQIVGVVAVGIYTAVATFLIFKIVDMLTGLRISKDEEQQGIDEITHGEKAYNEIF